MDEVLCKHLLPASNDCRHRLPASPPQFCHLQSLGFPHRCVSDQRRREDQSHAEAERLGSKYCWANDFAKAQFGRCASRFEFVRAVRDQNHFPAKFVAANWIRCHHLNHLATHCPATIRRSRYPIRFRDIVYQCVATRFALPTRDPAMASATTLVKPMRSIDQASSHRCPSKVRRCYRCH